MTTPVDPALAAAWQRADTLEAAGQWREAIDLLTVANRQQPDLLVEQRLVCLRLRAFEQTAWQENTSSWPPASLAGDQFHGVSGIPEITPAQLTAETLASGVLHHGALIVRGLLSGMTAAALAADVDRAVSARNAAVAGERQHQNPWCAPPSCLKQYALGVGRKFIAETGGVWAVDAPRALFHVMEVYEQLGLRSLLTQYFEDVPCLSVRKWVLRRVSPLPAEPDWHQDGAFMGLGVRSVNLWIALNRCGGQLDTPGIDLIPRRLDHLVQTGTDGARFDWVVGPALVEREFRDTPAVRPLFEAGDALFFDHTNLHRTAYASHITQNRYAIESWFFAAGKASEKQIPMLF